MELLFRVDHDAGHLAQKNKERSHYTGGSNWRMNSSWTLKELLPIITNGKESFSQKRASLLVGSSDFYKNLEKRSSKDGKHFMRKPIKHYRNRFTLTVIAVGLLFLRTYCVLRRNKPFSYLGRIK